MNRLFYSVCIILFSLSCSQEQDKDLVLSIFPENSAVIVAKDSINIDHLDILSAFFEMKYKDWFVFSLPRNHEDGSIIALYNPDTDEIIKGGFYGRGPNELTMVGSVQVEKNNAFIYGPNDKKCIKMDLDKLIARDRDYIINSDFSDWIFKSMPEIYIIDSSTYFGCESFQGDSWYSMYNKNGEKISSVPFVDYEVLKEEDNNRKSFVHIQSGETIKPDRSMVAYSGSSFGALSFSSMDNQSGFNELKRYIFYPPEIIQRDEYYPVYIFSKRRFFASIVSDNDYVFVLYFDSNHVNEQYPLMSRYLLQFDWSGNPVKSYLLNEPVNSIIVDNNSNRVIWALVEEPEMKLLKYEL